MINNPRKVRGLDILIINLFSSSTTFSLTTDPKSSHKDFSAHNHVDVPVDDVPQPTHKLRDNLQRIGNNVGEEIS